MHNQIFGATKGTLACFLIGSLDPTYFGMLHKWKLSTPWTDCSRTATNMEHPGAKLPFGLPLEAASQKQTGFYQCTMLVLVVIQKVIKETGPEGRAHCQTRGNKHASQGFSLSLGAMHVQSHWGCCNA